VLVLDSADTTPPFVELVTPEANDELTYLHDTLGTVRDDNLHRWWLEARPADRGGFRTLLTGTNGVENASLGQLDVTQLRNGIWILRLRAEDTNRQTSSVQIPVFVDGGAKLGIVHLEFTDLVVEDFGIPIAVNRIYDSRDAEQVGDFGHGWTLDIRQGSIQHNYPAGQGFALFTSTGDPVACQRTQDILGHFAEVRLSDDEWYTFRPILTGVGAISGSCGGDVAYELVDGARPGAELRIVGPRSVRATALNVIGPLGIVTESNLISTEDDTLFEPENFELLLPDGRRFGLNNERGITSITDRNGNSLVVVDGGPFGFGPTGLLHSSGRFVEFVRDPEGRITMIRDEGGRIVEYAYDADGNLVGFTDVLGRDTSYEYNASGHPHHLTDIIDWRGVRMAAIDYQDDGRMRELCDADGVCIEQQYDLAAQTMLRFTGLPAPMNYAYDTRGNISLIRDGLGNETSMTYGPPPFNVLATRTDPDGRTTRYEYLLDTRELTAVIPPTEAGEDPDLFRTDYSYQFVTHADTGNILIELQSMTLPSGGTVHYEVDARGNQTHVRDDDGDVIFERAFNPDGTIDAFTDRFGTVSYEYDDPQGLPTRVTEPDGTVTELDYDNDGNVIEVRRDGVTQRFIRDAAGRPLRTDYGNGAVVDYEYGFGDEWTAIEGPTFGRVERTLSSSGRLLSWTEPSGDTFSQTFDAVGQLRTRIDELGNVTTYTYDGAGRLETIFDAARGATTSYVRDPVGRILSQTNPDGEVRTFTYDPRGSIETTTDERMNVTTTTSLPTSTATTDPLSNTTTRNATAYGLPAGASFPGGASTSSTFLGDTQLDSSSSFPLTQVDESSRTRSFSYDANSVLTGATDLGGNPWTYAHAEVLGGDVQWDVQSGRVSLAAEGARAPVSRYAGRDESRDEHRPPHLDAWTDRLETVTSPLGEATHWTFGPGGEIERVDYPNGGVLSRTFGADLRVATETRPYGTTLTFGYDAAGRVTSRTGTDGSSQSFVYGAGDRLSSTSDATGTTTYHYDPAGRFSGLDYPSNLGFEQDHDEMDRVTAVRVHGDPAVDPTVYESTYTYDEAGNVETITDPFGRTTTYTYDALNRVDTITRPNGVTSAHAYDARGWVESIVHADSGGTVIASVAYVRNPSGEPNRITREDGSYVLVDYDAALRVERERYFDASDAIEEEISYTYDADGNRTSRTMSLAGGPPVTEDYVYGSGSELLRVEVGGVVTQEFTYDSGGRVTRIERGSDDLGFTYDADDHVVAIDDATTGETTEFDFDAEGRRTGRRVLNGATLLTAMAFATAPGLASGLDSPHVSDDGTGTAQTAYVYEGEHALARYDAASTEPVYYLRDAMGSVIGLVDDAGASSSRVHYDGFGNERRADGALAALPAGGGPRFQGMWAESGAGYYVRARRYDPLTGRFLSRDPVAQLAASPETAYPYILAANNPALFRDPTGQFFSLSELQISARIRSTLSTVTASATAFGQRLLRGLQSAGRSVFDLLQGVPRLLQSASSGARSVCFAAGTEVVVPDGTAEIQDLDIGDVVVARDLRTGRDAERKIIRVFERESPSVVRLTVGASAELSIDIYTTPEHPVYVLNREIFVPVEELVVGARVLTPHGTESIVRGLEMLPSQERVFNIEVEGLNNYYVTDAGDRAAAFLVHNTCVARAREALANLPPGRLFECRECAAQIVRTLRRVGVRGEIVHVQFRGGPGFVVSDLYRSGTAAISTNGYHVGVRVGGVVFDNLTRSGVPYDTWIRSIRSVGEMSLRVVPF